MSSAPVTNGAPAWHPVGAENSDTSCAVHVLVDEAAEAIASVADGCVVGSAIVKQIGEGRPVPEILAFVRDLAAGAHRG